MTSKISFFKLVKDEWKKLYWLMAVQLLGFLLLIPFRVLLVLGSAVSTMERWNAEISLSQEFYLNFGLGLNENTAAVLAAGMIVAICTFSYLFSAEKLDFLHSLPIRRTQLLAVKVAGSTLTFVIAWLTALILGLLVGGMYGVCSAAVIKEAAAVFVRGILQFLCSYGATLIAMMLTGKLLTAVLACFSLGFYIPVLVYLGYALQQVFYRTSFADIWNTSAWLPYTSPWSFCFLQKEEEVRKGLTGYWPSAGELCQLLALTAVLFLIAVLLYRIRQTEAAGRALAFRKTEGIVKVLIAVPIAILSAVLAHEMFEQLLWEIGFLVLFGVLVCMCMELIYRWDIRLVLKKKRHMLLTAGIAGLVFLVARFDVTGYNTYLPKKEDVQAMAVKDYYHSFFYPIEYEDEYAHYSVTRELMDYLETENFDLIYELVSDAVKSGHASDGMYEGEDYCYGYVKFHLKNGKEMYRRYRMRRTQYAAVMDELVKDEKFRTTYYPILSWEENSDFYQDAYAGVPREYLTQFTEEGKDAKKTWEMSEEELEAYWNERSEQDSAYYYVDVTIPEEKVWEVVELYQKELTEASYTEILESNGALNFYFVYSGKGDQSWTGLNNFPLPYTFEETLSLLAEIWQAQE